MKTRIRWPLRRPKANLKPDSLHGRSLPPNRGSRRTRPWRNRAGLVGRSDRRRRERWNLSIHYGRSASSIQVVNTHRGFIDRVRDVVGCGTISPREPRGLDKGRKTVYHYSLKGSERGLKLLDPILPHLIIKREKAETIAHELRTRPFGRWANATPEARRTAGERMKRAWQDPEIRARRIAGLRRWRQEVVHRG